MGDADRRIDWSREFSDFSVGWDTNVREAQKNLQDKMEGGNEFLDVILNLATDAGKKSGNPLIMAISKAIDYAHDESKKIGHTEGLGYLGEKTQLAVESFDKKVGRQSKINLLSSLLTVGTTEISKGLEAKNEAKTLLMDDKDLLKGIESGEFEDKGITSVDEYLASDLFKDKIYEVKRSDEFLAKWRAKGWEEKSAEVEEWVWEKTDSFLKSLLDNTLGIKMPDDWLDFKKLKEGTKDIDYFGRKSKGTFTPYGSKSSD